MKNLFLFIICCLPLASQTQQILAVPVIVEAEQNGPSSLSAADLRVEVNRHPVSVASVVPLGDKHLQYVLIHDASVHTQWPGGTRRQADVAEQFLKSVTSNQDFGGLINFNDVVWIDAQNEADPQVLASKLQRNPKGGTALYEAITSTTQYLEKQPPRPGFRKALFLFCDGYDDTNQKSLGVAITALQKARIQIFIFAPTAVEEKAEGKNLRQLASESGGRVYFLPPDSTSFEPARRDLAESYMVNLNIGEGNKSVPITITDPAQANVPVVVAARVFASR